MKKVEILFEDERYVLSKVIAKDMPFGITQEKINNATVTNFILGGENDPQKLILTTVTRNGETYFNFDEDLLN